MPKSDAATRREVEILEERIAKLERLLNPPEPTVNEATAGLLSPEQEALFNNTGETGPAGPADTEEQQ